MNSIIVNLIFGTLTMIFITGIVIIIINALKIKIFSQALKKQLKQQEQVKMLYFTPEPQNKLIQLLTKPILQINAPDKSNMKLLY